MNSKSSQTPNASQRDSSQFMFNFQTCLKTIALCLASLICTVLPASQDDKDKDKRPSVAILEPKSDNPAITKGNKITARGALETYVLSTKRFRVVDYARIDVAVDAIIRGQGSLFDPDTIRELGKRLNANYFCVSELHKEEGNFFATASIINAETGVVIGSTYEVGVMSSDKIREVMDIRNLMNTVAKTLADTLIDDLNTTGGETTNTGTNTPNASNTGTNTPNASSIRISVVKVRNHQLDELKEALRSIEGVDDVTIINYDSKNLKAIIDVAFGLSTQDLLAHIRNKKSLKLKVLGESYRAIEVSM